jgi:hypothetical protein
MSLAYNPTRRPKFHPEFRPNNPSHFYARKYFTTVNNCTIHFLTDKPGVKIMTLTEFFESACVAAGVVMLMAAAIAAPFILFR